MSPIDGLPGGLTMSMFAGRPIRGGADGLLLDQPVRRRRLSILRRVKSPRASRRPFRQKPNLQQHPARTRHLGDERGIAHHHRRSLKPHRRQQHRPARMLIVAAYFRATQFYLGGFESGIQVTGEPLLPPLKSVLANRSV